MSDLKTSYKKRHADVLVPLAEGLQAYLQDLLSGVARVDRIAVRPKSVDRFMGKAAAQENGKPKYTEPLVQIQDQIGARIIVFYKSDVEPISKTVLKYFRPIESKNLIPETEWTFGYFGKHHVLLTPTDLVDRAWDSDLVPQSFELQIKTLFQHAWSEANHDLGYKPGELPLEPDEERQLAYTSAQAWGADRMFDELFRKRSGRSR